MLIPKFRLDQTPDSLVIKIHSPYTKIDETEIYVDQDEFVFSSPPYHLRLNLPGKILENAKTIAKYECEAGDFIFTFDKENKGEMFENLDMVTSLLAPKQMGNLNPNLIEVISGGSDSGVVESNESAGDSVLHPSLGNTYTYGFANKMAGAFKDLGGEFSNIFELRTPEEVSYFERKAMRQDQEDERFSSDHYLADFFDEELIEPLLLFEAPWMEVNSKEKTVLTDEEIDVLKDLPNKEYLLNKDEYNSVLLNLVDILFAYAYEKRITFDESTVESSWTVNHLSATLSWFETFITLKETLICCFRRSLIYPMYRNFKLSLKVKQDVAQIFKNGRGYVVRCLIEIYQLFNSSQDARYILNQIYIRDFLIFSQKCSEETYKTLYENINNIVIEKCNLGLELEEFEEAGEMVQMEESEILANAAALQLASLKLTEDKVKETKSNDNRLLLKYYDSSDSSEDSSSDSSDSSELDSDDDSCNDVNDEKSDEENDHSSSSDDDSDCDENTSEDEEPAS